MTSTLSFDTSTLKLLWSCLAGWTVFCSHIDKHQRMCIIQAVQRTNCCIRSQKDYKFTARIRAFKHILPYGFDRHLHLRVPRSLFRPKRRVGSTSGVDCYLRWRSKRRIGGRGTHEQTCL
ncbi:uncharacterized protein F5147DRAFT_276036 [Suillus discolor]|uniref:Secreted protein n=1 Tax=Suillus discolor TaxID=1912936 RepID=A0A9P7F2L4_9AGAM|nr:uncharacterized protein F5147DRAFT_276036 [Suillus discolor]KAG2103775.1 hypothetical protein F5147DRAFT_276036 [Suillus discolor]